MTHWGIGSFFLAIGALAMGAQHGPPPDTLVSVAVSVTSRSGNERVKGLTAADFRIFEDATERSIVSVSEGSVPVSIAIVLDASDSMVGVRQQLAQQAVERLAGALGTDDEISMLTYDGTIKVAVPWTAGGSVPKLEWVRWKTMPSSELLQGIYQAFGQMNEAKNARIAVIAISSAEQAASRHGLRDFVKSRREGEVSIHGLRTADLLSAPAGIGGPRPGGRGTTVWDSRGAAVSFDDLVRDSGGRVLPARTTTEVDRSVDALLTDLRTQYVVTFKSAKPFDGTYRLLKVEVRNGSYKLRHRLGYLAKPD